MNFNCKQIVELSLLLLFDIEQLFFSYNFFDNIFIRLSKRLHLFSFKYSSKQFRYIFSPFFNTIMKIFIIQ
ncbi:hypothetical protein DERP_011611 [Dermatophagoides pteronyssinus]|uniref:Uncharacterized protein n=1 Tax=Dermatophagoides pteronyssinus TaxID=6956 RepID=A0ABQ8JXJ3_DERPT|nr:hypothetical protein DERP_011611 [Dermatophagoides pteronyssinus]